MGGGVPLLLGERVALVLLELLGQGEALPENDSVTSPLADTAVEGLLEGLLVAEAQRLAVADCSLGREEGEVEALPQALPLPVALAQAAPLLLPVLLVLALTEGDTLRLLLAPVPFLAAGTAGTALRFSGAGTGRGGSAVAPPNTACRAPPCAHTPGYTFSQLPSSAATSLTPTPLLLSAAVRTYSCRVTVLLSPAEMTRAGAPGAVTGSRRAGEVACAALLAATMSHCHTAGGAAAGGRVREAARAGGGEAPTAPASAPPAAACRP